jgi:hypothetical protein
LAIGCLAVICCASPCTAERRGRAPIGGSVAAPKMGFVEDVAVNTAPDITFFLGIHD